MKPAHISLRTWLLGLSLLATAPMLAFSLSAVWEFKQFQQDTLLSRLERRSDGLAQAVAQNLESTVATLSALAESDAALALDVPRLYASAQRVVKRNADLRSISLADQKGVLFLTASPLAPIAWPLNAPTLVTECMATLRPNVSGPFKSPVGPIQVVAVTVPIVKNGQSTHVLRGILTVESINHTLEKASLPAGWIAAVADRQGTFVARSTAAERYVGQKVNADFQNAITTLDTQTREGITLDGTPIFFRSKPVFGGDWHVAVAVSQALLEAPLKDMLWRMAALAMLWVALATLLALGFARHLTRQVSTVAEAMAQGRLTLPAQPRVRVTELLEVFDSFGAVKHNEALAHGALGVAQSERDEVQDLYDHAPCGYHSLDAQGRVVRMNQTELDWLGRTLPEVLGRPFVEFLSPSSQPLFQQNYAAFVNDGHISNLAFELVHSSGSTRPVLVSATALRDADGRFVASRTTLTDHTAQRHFEAELARLAHTDALTGLANRRAFMERAGQEVARCQRTGAVCQVLMLDVDFFKQVNDHHGHAAGDEVLRELSRQLQTTLRGADTPARWGGEEFAVLLPETPWRDACRLAERLRAAMGAARVQWAGQHIAFTVSIGVAQWLPEECIDATLARADKALYEAKRTGRNRVCTDRGGDVSVPAIG